jgi:ankyrin repeat protein
LAVRNRAGLTAAESARLLGQTDTVALIEAVSDKRLPAAERALREAVRATDVTAVRSAIVNNARVDLADPQGFTPLIWAAREGYDAIVTLLLEHGADPNQNDVWMRANAGHKAAFWGRAGALRLLAAHGLNLDAQGGYNGYTALHDAVAGKHYEAARLLIEAGARTDIPGHDGKTARDLAQTSNAAQLIALVVR